MGTTCNSGAVRLGPAMSELPTAEELGRWMECYPPTNWTETRQDRATRRLIRALVQLARDTQHPNEEGELAQFKREWAAVRLPEDTDGGDDER